MHMLHTFALRVYFSRTCGSMNTGVCMNNNNINAYQCGHLLPWKPIIGSYVPVNKLLFAIKKSKSGRATGTQSHEHDITDNCQIFRIKCSCLLTTPSTLVCMTVSPCYIRMVIYQFWYSITLFWSQCATKPFLLSRWAYMRWSTWLTLLFHIVKCQKLNMDLRTRL